VISTPQPTQVATLRATTPVNKAAAFSVTATPESLDVPIKFTPSQALALGGLVAVILIGFLVIARRHA
jgi:hypothetical protein